MLHKNHQLEEIDQLVNTDQEIVKLVKMIIDLINKWQEIDINVWNNANL